MNTREELQSAAPGDEQALIVHFRYGHGDWTPFFAFQETLKRAISMAAIGEYDGNELAVDGSDGSMYMYAPDADALFTFVKPYLLGAQFLCDIVVTLRYGGVDDPSVRRSRIKLTP